MLPFVYQDFISFLKKPQKPEAYSKMPSRNFLFLLIGAIVLVIPFSFILELIGADQFDSELAKLLEKSRVLVFVAGVFLAPLIEEPIFRLHLDLKLSSIIWGFFLSFLLLAQQWVITVVFMVYLIYLFVNVASGEKIRLKFVVFTSSILFALIHIGNFLNFDFATQFYWIPFLVAIQFFIGLILSYIRLKHGIWYAILFHGVYNGIFIIPAVLFYEP